MNDPGPSICARPGRSVARNRVPVVGRHALRSSVPLCRSRQSVARNRPARAEGAFRHRAPNPFAGGFPKMSVIFVQIPVMARPLASSCMPLCDLGEGCVAKDTVSPPATYAVQRFPVRHARADSGWGGRVGPVNACPSVCSLCGRKTICPEKMAIERAEARRVPTGHLVLDRAKSRRQRLPVRAEIRSLRRQAG